MPQPIATQDQWNQVRDTAVACGSIKEAAAVHGVSYQAAKQRAKRQAWPVARRLNKAIVQARAAASRSLEAATGRVTSVTSTPNALVAILSERKERTRLGLSRYAAEAAEQAAEHRDKLGIAGKVKDVAGVHKTLWPEEPKTNQILNIGILTGAIPVYDAKTGEVLSGPGCKRKELP